MSKLELAAQYWIKGNKLSCCWLNLKRLCRHRKDSQQNSVLHWIIIQTTDGSYRYGGGKSSYKSILFENNKQDDNYLLLSATTTRILRGKRFLLKLTCPSRASRWLQSNVAPIMNIICRFNRFTDDNHSSLNFTALSSFMASERNVVLNFCVRSSLCVLNY